MAGCFEKPTEVFERSFCIHRVSKNWEGRAERRDARVQVVEDASGQLDRAKLVGNYRFRVTLDPETGIV